MELYHCTEFSNLKRILESQCLSLSDIAEFPSLACLGVRGVWVSTESYGDQFFGPYQIRMSANNVLPHQFLLISSTESRDILFGSYSPSLQDIGAITGYSYIASTNSNCPMFQSGQGWQKKKKVDIILDSPLPARLFTAFSAGASFRNRNGAPTSGWDRSWSGSGARFAALLLTMHTLSFPQISGEDARSLAKRLFRELCGGKFNERAEEVRGVMLPADLAAFDIVASASERLVANSLDDARLIAALAVTEQHLAELVAAAISARFQVAQITGPELLDED